MATADLLFDPSAYRYPEYVGGLSELVEQLTPDELRSCWFHNLQQAHRKVMMEVNNMTQDQVQHIEQLLVRGIGQADVLQPSQSEEWEDAEYDPDKKMSCEDHKQRRRRQRICKNLRVHNYDPLLLLQSTTEISLHAKRLFLEGAPRFLNRLHKKGTFETRKLEDYKLNCAHQARDHVKQLLEASYWEKANANSGQVASENNPIKAKGRSEIPWDRALDWEPVRAQLKVELTKIASELESGHLTEQIDEMHRESVDGLANGLQRLLGDDGMPTGSQSKEGLGKPESGRLTQAQALLRMKRLRRQRKELARRADMERRIIAGPITDTKPVPKMSGKENLAAASINNSAGPQLSVSDHREHEKPVYDQRNTWRRLDGWADGPLIPTGPRGFGRNLTLVNNLVSRRGKKKKVAMKVEASDDLHGRNGNDMVVDVSERVEKMEM